MDDKRPEWTHKSMNEGDFRKIHRIGMITSVKAKWEMTGSDTSREWLTVTNTDGDTVTLPPGWLQVLKFVGYASSPGLFGYTYEGEQMLKSLLAIDTWEKKNKAERATYERLKAKFNP